MIKLAILGLTAAFVLVACEDSESEVIPITSDSQSVQYWHDDLHRVSCWVVERQGGYNLSSPAVAISCIDDSKVFNAR